METTLASHRGLLEAAELVKAALLFSNGWTSTPPNPHNAAKIENEQTALQVQVPNNLYPWSWIHLPSK